MPIKKAREPWFMYISHRGATLRVLNEYAACGDELEDVNLANFGGGKRAWKSI